MTHQMPVVLSHTPLGMTLVQQGVGGTEAMSGSGDERGKRWQVRDGGGIAEQGDSGHRLRTQSIRALVFTAVHDKGWGAACNEH